MLKYIIKGIPGFRTGSKGKRIFVSIIYLFIIGIVVNIVATQQIENQKESHTKSSTIKLHYIDVGESDSTLIQSDGEFMLIDAGDIGDGDDIVDYLLKQGVEKLEYLILTHPHADHIGGAQDIINEFKIDKIIMPAKEHTTKTFEELLITIKMKGLKITTPVVGDNYSIGNAKFSIIAPNHYNYGDNLNDYSVGIRLVNGKNSFVFIGDAEKEAINDILKNENYLDSNVLMLGHHGSDTSTTEELLNHVSPKYAIISVGKNNYGHPSGETLQLLSDKNITTYRTDENGTIIATSTGTEITFNGQATSLTSKSNSIDKSIDTSTTKNSNKTVYITKTGKKYHLSSCRSLRFSKIKTTVKEAKAKDLTACSICNPPE